MLRGELHMLAVERVGVNLRPAVSHYDSHLQADSRSRTGVQRTFETWSRARKRFPALGSYVRGIRPTTAKV
jgi:hypothetical protein